MPMTDPAIKNAKPGEKRRKISDEKSLYLPVTVTMASWKPSQWVFTLT